MAIREIPLRNDIAAYTFSVDLDNRPFKFRMKFNDRTGLWSFDIFNDADVILLGGIPLFVKQLLIDKYQHNLRLPQGNLFAQNLVNPDDPPNRDNIGIDVILLYEDAS